ncbi:MAG TPA: tyrosine--tRNA ligase, partial [Flavobacterium sp.]|nr:tyrosine--tRNA ligase [Flavobacterium sp.]
KSLDSATFLEIFDGVPQAEVNPDDLKIGIDIVALLNEKTGFMKSNGEARRALAENSISVNREKVAEDFTLNSEHLINGEFVLLQRGKKNYFIVKLG